MSHDEIEIEAVGIEVSSQPVELYKVLKLANAVSGGGEAKMAISEGYVVVNGEVETRKRRKIYDGDLIAFNDEFYVLICDVAPAPQEPRVAKVKPAESAKNTKSAPQGTKAKSGESKKKQNNTASSPRKPSDDSKSERVAPNGRKQITF